jgi:hypothetical protein
MRQLLTPEQMDQLRAMAASASHFPSQGSATVFETLNLHTEPNRTSPSFAQIPENGQADVIAHKLMPRVQDTPVSLPKPVKPVTRKKSKPKSSSQTRIPPPPRAPAPALPQNWVALSVPKAEPDPPVSAPVPVVPAAPPAPVPMDDWSLIRTRDGRVGWVLTHPLNMAIPDEVAQYAEGHRITSYFALGQVHDGDTVKNNWLWTTINKGGEPYEFDSFRVFVWSLKHHRYETAYIERNIEGHFPTTVNNSSDAPSFSVIVEGVDGNLYKKTYSFDGYRIRMSNREVYAPAAATSKPTSIASASPQPQAKRSWSAAITDRFHRIFR